MARGTVPAEMIPRNGEIAQWLPRPDLIARVPEQHDNSGATRGGLKLMAAIATVAGLAYGAFEAVEQRPDAEYVKCSVNYEPVDAAARQASQTGPIKQFDIYQQPVEQAPDAVAAPVCLPQQR
jgi:hypothetical protein